MDGPGNEITPSSAAGVYRQPASGSGSVDLETGAPLFLGFTTRGPRTPHRPSDPEWSDVAYRLTSWAAFVDACGEPGDPRSDGYLGWAVRGFFQNGGRICHVLPLDRQNDPVQTMSAALEASKATDAVDLICVPDVARHERSVALAIQQLVLDSTSQSHRFAILDSVGDANLEETVGQWQRLSGKNGALYYPWVWISDPAGRSTLVPPCGHVAGVFARTDRAVGVFKAPANEPLDGVHDVAIALTEADQESADPQGVVNCLRAFPTRGIRVWGARTTTGEPAWKHVNVVRLFQTIARWVERNMIDVVMEPNDVWLWARIRRELNDYLFKLFSQGALKGATPQEAYFLKCDDETTPAERREQGQVVVEVGLAAVVPGKFIVVRFVYGEDGVSTNLTASNV